MLIRRAVVVDDQEKPREANAGTAQRRGLEVDSFADLDAARAFIFRCDEPMLVILDHNFEGDSRSGFHLCESIRMDHTFGLLMPIIYVSGLLEAGRFIDEQRGRMMYGPTVFLPKTAMSQLGDVIEATVKGFEDLWTRAIEQAGQQALYQMSIEV